MVVTSSISWILVESARVSAYTGSTSQISWHLPLVRLTPTQDGPMLYAATMDSFSYTSGWMSLTAPPDCPQWSMYSATTAERCLRVSTKYWHQRIAVVSIR